MCFYQQEKTKNTNKKITESLLNFPLLSLENKNIIKNSHDIKKLLKISSFSSQFIPSVVLSEARMLWKYLCYIIFLYRYVSHTARRPSVCVLAPRQACLSSRMLSVPLSRRWRSAGPAPRSSSSGGTASSSCRLPSSPSSPPPALFCTPERQRHFKIMYGTEQIFAKLIQHSENRIKIKNGMAQNVPLGSSKG